jgi:hypothetical protein
MTCAGIASTAPRRARVDGVERHAIEATLFRAGRDLLRHALDLAAHRRDVVLLRIVVAERLTTDRRDLVARLVKVAGEDLDRRHLALEAR